MPATWKVTNVQMASGKNPDGSFGSGWSVTYQLDDGTIGQVFVAKQGATDDTIKEAITADAERLHSIATLTSG